MARGKCVQFTIADFKEVLLPNESRDAVRKALEQLEQLLGTRPITICTAGATSRRGKSPYNQFIGGCMKGKTGPVPARMKACAAEWREKKR